MCTGRATYTRSDCVTCVRKLAFICERMQGAKSSDGGRQSSRNATRRTSMLSLSSAPSGVAGSSKPEWSEKVAGTSAEAALVFKRGVQRRVQKKGHTGSNEGHTGSNKGHTGSSYMRCGWALWLGGMVGRCGWEVCCVVTVWPSPTRERAAGCGFESRQAHGMP